VQEEIKNPEVMNEEASAEENASKKENKKKAKKSDAEAAELKAALEAREKELAELGDKYLRLYAEYDNFRRRSAKEREAIYFDAKSDTLKNILPILDNMERATAFTEADKVLEGMNLILKSFNENFVKMDVKEIEALGKTFDPNLHYAVMHIEDEAYGESEVVEVLQKGYICGDKVIRYAMVKVAN
jgi:molecular chaperone GrpE